MDGYDWKPYLPYQQAYFNFLVDRETPGLLGDQYPLEYWGTSYLLKFRDSFLQETIDNLLNNIGKGPCTC